MVVLNLVMVELPLRGSEQANDVRAKIEGTLVLRARRT